MPSVDFMDICVRNYSSSDRDDVLRVCELGPLPLSLPLDSLRGARKFVAVRENEIIGFGAIDVEITCTVCAYATLIALCSENDCALSALKDALYTYAKNCGVTVIRNRL